ncbi:MAG: glutamine-hydrolyzing carbamoyl-phosphate synthase small subunit [Chloroflexota bacterium]
MTANQRFGLERGPKTPLQATLMLADGTRFVGWGLGDQTTTSGELIFTTAMTGYEEALTDPSYRGQLLMFTYPLIGSYGTAPRRRQSEDVQPRGAILATLSPGSGDQPSLRDYLLGHRVPTMYGVDTRAIARWIREYGALPAVLTVHDPQLQPQIDALQSAIRGCDYDSTDFVAETTVTHPELHGAGSRLVALLDCGNKRSVIETIVRRDVRVVVLPAHTPAADILRLQPRGLIISNGPGNPATATSIVATVRELYGKLPLFGICFGHQLLALAAGAGTYKLRFGHRGANHPVQDCVSGQAFVTTQNHGFAVDPASLPGDLYVSHRNVNDSTVEGLRHTDLYIRSVQFHPEGAPGPRDSGVILDDWLAEIA